MIGVNNINGGPIAELERVDEIHLRDFARLIRLFEMKKERSSVEGVIGALRREGVSPDIESKFSSILELFRKKEERQVFISSSDTGQMSPNFKRAFDVYINGHLLHGQQEEREEWRKYVSSDLEPYFYTLFLCSLINKANAVTQLYDLLKENGYLDTANLK